MCNIIGNAVNKVKFIIRKYIGVVLLKITIKEVGVLFLILSVI